MIVFNNSSSPGSTPVVAITWDPANLVGTGAALKNSNLTFYTTTTGTERKARSTTSHIVGKYYFEIQATDTPANNTALGIGNATQASSSSNYLGQDSNGIGYWPQAAAGMIAFVNNSPLSNRTVTNAINHYYGFAVDFGAQLIWVRDITGDAGTAHWNSNTSTTADPSIVNGGDQLAAFGGDSAKVMAAGPYYIIADLETSTFANGMVLNVGATSYQGVVPTGFNNWSISEPSGYTTWDPANLVGNTTLARNNLCTLQLTTPSPADSGVRSTTSHSTGKYYFEVEVMNGSGLGGSTGVGFGNASALTTTFLGGSNNNGVGVFLGNAFFNNASTQIYANAGSQPQYSWLAFCVDLTNSLMWTRNITADAGTPNWNNTSANPAGGTGGFSFSTINAGPYYIWCDYETFDTSFYMENLNSGYANYQGTVPSGFSTW